MTRCLYKLNTSDGKLVPIAPRGTPCTSCGHDAPALVNTDVRGTRWTCGSCGNLFAAILDARHRHDPAPAVQPASNPAPSVPRKENHAMSTATIDPVCRALSLENAKLQAQLDERLFLNAVEAHVANGLPYSRAVAAVANEQPELHRSYLESYNRAHGRRL